MRVGFTYDLMTDWDFAQDDPVDANADLDSPGTVDFIAEALEAGGHEVVRIGHVQNLLRRIKNLDVDIVFNICEGKAGRNRESEVPVLLEMEGIPFVGADALTLGVTLDKVAAKKCFIADGIPTARYFVAHDSSRLEEQNHIGFPLFVKPRYEGTSKSLSEQSRVTDYEGLKRQVDLINNTYRQPALVEEFISGREFTVPVLGNDSPEAMCVVQVQIDGKLDLGDTFFTFELVREAEAKVKYVCPAPIENDLAERMKTLALATYQSVDCRDFGRVDFRMDDRGNLFVLEINPLPSLARKDVFNIFPQTLGYTYVETVNRVLNHALERYDLSPETKVLRRAQDVTLTR